MSSRHVAVRLILFLLCCLPVMAQLGGVPRGPMQASTGDVTVTGVVVNSVTGEPIPRALIQLSGVVQRSALTDSEGKFQFENLPETQAMFMAQKPGFFSDMQLQGMGMGRVHPTVITAGMGSVTVKLMPAGVIAGRITGTDGEPVEGSRVRVKMRMIQNGRRQWIERGGATTDDDGYYRITNLMPGAYYVFTDGGFRTWSPATNEAFTPAYYPGVNDISGASAIEVRPGITANADMVLKKERAYRVSGTVTGLQQGQNANVELLSSGGDPFPANASFSAAGNTFEIRRVPAGSYVLKVFAQERMNTDVVNPGFRATGVGQTWEQPQTYVGSVPITVNGDLTGVTIPVQATATIPLEVRTDFSNSQQSGMPMSSRPMRGPFVNLHLTRTDGQRGDYFAQPEGSGDNMRFVIRNVEPGRYRAVFESMGGNMYVQSASYGNVDLLRDELVVGMGGDQPIQVTLRDDAANLSGTANCPDTQCWVVVVPDSSPAFMPRTIFVNNQGAFRADGLPPGSYRLYAFDRTDGIEFTNPEAMKAYSSKSETVVLSAGQRTQVNLELTKVSDQ